MLKRTFYKWSFRKWYKEIDRGRIMTRTLRLKDLESAAANASEQPFFTTGSSGRNGVRGTVNAPPQAQGMIFDADFANAPDWQPDYAGQRYRHIGDDSSPNAANNVPPNFDFYYMNERWHPDGFSDGVEAEPTNQPVAQISNRHGSRLDPVNGKAFIIYDESFGTASQWGSDAVLTKDLGAEYTEFWVEFWIRFQPNYQWEAEIVDGGQSAMKLFRCRRHSGIATDNRFSFFGADARSGSPVFMGNLKVWRDKGRTIMREDPKFRGYTHPDDHNTENDRYLMGSYNDSPDFYLYQGGENSLNWEDTFGNAEWHKINYYIKMDTFPGSNDGVYEFWLNDILEHSVTDIPWRTEGDPENIGWNEIAIGGNQNNVWEPQENKAEQWYQVDELKIYNGKPE